MKTNRNILLILMVLVFLKSVCFASNYLAYTGYSRGSSKVIGMGGAFTGIADDVNSIIYNPAGFAFSDYNNYVSLNYVNFIDKSFDFDKASKDDVWKSEATNFGFLHKTKKSNGFTWGFYLDGLYNLTFTNNLADKNKFVLDMGHPGERYEISFSLTRILFPLIWKYNDRLAFGVNASILVARLSYDYHAPADYMSVYEDSTTFHCDLSAMYKVSDKVQFGIMVRPPAYFDVNENRNADIGTFKWFNDIHMPLQINTGVGYKMNKQFMFDFDLHYAKFDGNEILPGSNLVPEFAEYKLKTRQSLSPHLGGQYQSTLMKKDFFVRAGYYYQPGLFETLEDKHHFTYSLSWRLIKLPAWVYVMEYLSVGFSNDIADNYDVQTFTLDSDF
ncbi:MAG: hypothetical protein A2252_09880 [Elusimicrobia bacterium RIFOXYA2_FULL_39_19]|nr:MAG: hypothetical protein A2252_09880 [Elusimicrobia bacterium RIFOXYA2_FULL_39_19]